MADMNSRHHKLIQDAVAEGVKKAVDRLFYHGATEKMVRRSEVIREASNGLADTLAEKLRYTHDKFDDIAFRQQLRTRISSQF